MIEWCIEHWSGFAGIAAGSVILIVLILIFDRPPPRPPRTKLYLSWYRDARPWMNEKKWLADAWDGEGHVYVRDRDQATRYTKERAQELTPKYDGSGGIEKRAGIERA